MNRETPKDWQLSASGEQRRQQMLIDLQSHAQRAATRKRIRRTGFASLLVAITVTSAGIYQFSQTGSAVSELNSQPDLTVNHTTTTGQANRLVLAEIVVNNQPDVTDKYVVRNSDIPSFGFRLESIRDDRLQQTLEESGKNTLVARIEDQLVLLEPKGSLP